MCEDKIKYTESNSSENIQCHFKWHCNNTIKIPVCDLHLKEIYDLVVWSCSLNVTWGVTSFVRVRRTWKQKQFGYSLSYWAYFYLILRLVIKCETTAIVRLWSHSSLEDFVTRDKIVSCLMSVWWSWIENDSDIGLTNDSDIGLTNPDNEFLKKKKKKKKKKKTDTDSIIDRKPCTKNLEVNIPSR